MSAPKIPQARLEELVKNLDGKDANFFVENPYCAIRSTESVAMAIELLELRREVDELRTDIADRDEYDAYARRAEIEDRERSAAAREGK